MELIEGIRTRRSVRKFTDEKISRDTMARIVDAARFAPTWKNSQTPRYIVVENRQVMEQIAAEGVMGRAHNAGIIRGAAALVVLTSVRGICGYEPDGSFSTSKGNEWQMFDAGIAAQTFCRPSALPPTITVSAPSSWVFLTRRKSGALSGWTRAG